MIPLSYFLIAWILLASIFFLYALITVGVYLKFGVAGSFTSATAALFLGVALIVICGSAYYFTMVDWSKPIGFFEYNLTPNSGSQLEL